MRQNERDMGKFAQAVNRLVEWVGCKRRRLIIVTVQDKARFAADMSSELNPSMELDALNHNWLLVSSRSLRSWSQRRLPGAGGACALRHSH